MAKSLSKTVLFLALFWSGTACATRDELATLADAASWLEKESHRVIRASQRIMKDGTAAFPPQVGIGYEAFWLRDYAYTLEGSVEAYSDQELLDACHLFLRSLRSDGAGVDCVKFDGAPVYMPGYGTMGQNPVADGSQFTVAVARHTYRRTKNAQLLRESIEPLVKAMNAVPRNPDTGLVHIRPGEPWDRCPYGFTDTVRKQGDELFCSLLYVQASRQLADLLDSGGRAAEAGNWRQEAERVAGAIRRVFWDPQAGLFRAATVCCREHDIWGSAFAVVLGVADREQAKAVATVFRRDYSGLVQRGQIRHLPPGIYWEKGCPRDTYQNGGYWATPTGWFVYTLDLVDPALADRTVSDLVKDFQSGGACEWVFKDVRRLPNYLASASLPLAGIRAMMERRQSLPALGPVRSSLSLFDGFDGGSVAAFWLPGARRCSSTIILWATAARASTPPDSIIDSQKCKLCPWVALAACCRPSCLAARDFICHTLGGSSLNTAMEMERKKHAE